MFDENLYHASFGGKTGRRMFTMCYGNAPGSESVEAFLGRSYGRPMLNASQGASLRARLPRLIWCERTVVTRGT